MTIRIRELTLDEVFDFDFRKFGFDGPVNSWLHQSLRPAILVVERVRPWIRSVGPIAFTMFTRPEYGFSVQLMAGLTARHAEVYCPQMVSWFKAHLISGGVIRALGEATERADKFFRSQEFKAIRRVRSPCGRMEFWEYQWPPPMSRNCVQTLARDLAGDLSVGTDEEDPIPELDRKLNRD